MKKKTRVSNAPDMVGPVHQYFIIAIIWGNSYHDLSAKTTKYSIYIWGILHKSN